MSLRGSLRALRSILSRDPRREVDEELRFHLQRRARDYMERGLDEAAAGRAARERFGDVGHVRGECVRLLAAERRARRRQVWLDDLRGDVRFAIRSAIRAPLFTGLAVATLALGIGANAAVFGVVKSTLLDALPYRDSGRIARLYGRSVDGTVERTSLSAGAIRDYRERARSLEAIGVFFPATYDVVHQGAGEPHVLTAALAGPGFFPTLGVEPVLGRAFSPEDVESEAPVALLDWATWRNAFGADEGVVGRTLVVDRQPYAIIGVLPRDFVGPVGRADVWFGMGIEGALRDPERARSSRSLGAVARLRDGVTVSAAQRELATITAELGREHPASDAGHTATLVPIREAMVGDTRLPLLVLMASAALVLIAACVNLAGAILSRTVSRRGELATRVALGAGRGRLARQLLTECGLLAVAGATAGSGIAGAAMAALRRLPPGTLPAYADLDLDAGVFVAMAVVALAATAAVGIAPAVTAGRADVQRTLRGSGDLAGEGRGARRLRGLLVATQIALSLSLLAGAGLLARSLRTMGTAPLGYDPTGVLAVSVKGPVPATDGARARFFRELLDGVGALPGVSTVASTSALPSPAMRRDELTLQGRVRPDGESPPSVAFATVSDAYFRAMRIPVVEGRTFDTRDGADASRAIVVSEGVARRWWPAGDAVGARVRIGSGPSTPWAVVVGVVGDVRNDPTLASGEPMAYGSDRQDALRTSRAYVVRTEGDATRLIEPFRRVLTALDPGVPMADATPLSASVARGLQGRRLPTLLIGGFAALTLLLASMGVYALFANMVAAGERELGVRLALGSSPRRIAWLLVGRGALWLGAGLCVGGAGVALVGHALRSLLFGVSPVDPIALTGAAAVLVAAAAVALVGPVLRATRVAANSVLR